MSVSTPIMPTPTMQSFNEDEESKREAFYEELNERLLAIECDQLQLVFLKQLNSGY